jgi:hypothetical protein
MNQRAFANKVGNNQEDILQVFLDVLQKTLADYCVIGGLAVNAYAEPVVSLDLDVAVITDKIKEILSPFSAAYTIRTFPHSINISCEKSDFRIQIQTDPRYLDFLPRAKPKQVLGYDMLVADVRDVLQGKIWAYQDQTRRASKRLKDLADIARLIEAKPKLAESVPDDIRSKIE